jgi:divalent metal cation (Fe/Co/Zn/Cd) transporter
MHCTFEPGLPVRAVHDISSELENRLRAAIPGLARVTTHPEPADAGEAADSPSS